MVAPRNENFLFFPSHSIINNKAAMLSCVSACACAIKQIILKAITPT